MKMPAFVSAFFLALLAASAQAAGPFPADIAAWTEADKAQQREAGKELVAKIMQASKAGQKSLTIPAGQYRFEKPGQNPWTHLHLRDLQNMTIDFQGSTLWFETGAPGLLLSRCKNLTIKNLNLDWDPLPFTQGTIIAIDTKTSTVDVQLSPGYDRVTDGLANASGPNSNLRGFLFDSKTRQLKPAQHGFSLQPFWKDRPSEGVARVPVAGFYGVALKDLNFAIGDMIALLKRDGRAVQIQGCEGISLHNINLYASPFVCIAEGPGEGGTLYDHVNIVRRPGTDRLMAGNADGINCSNLAKGPIIDSCTIETLGDDFVNVHGHFGRVLAQENSSEIIVSKLHFRGGLPENTPVEIYHRDSFEHLGSRKVIKTQLVNFRLDPQTTTADLKVKWHSGDAAALDYGKTVQAMKLTLDAPINTGKDAILISENFVGAGAVVKNCTFSGSVARGIRLQAPHCRIENNTLSWIGGPAITLTSQPEFWGEGTNAHHSVITGNTIQDSNLFDRIGGGERVAVIIASPGKPISGFPLHDIDFSNNTIIRSGGGAIAMRQVADVIMKNNKIVAPNTLPAFRGSSAETSYPIVIERCKNVTLDQNDIIEMGKYAKGTIWQDQTKSQNQ